MVSLYEQYLLSAVSYFIVCMRAVSLVWVLSVGYAGGAHEAYNTMTAHVGGACSGHTVHSLDFYPF